MGYVFENPEMKNAHALSKFANAEMSNQRKHANSANK